MGVEIKRADKLKAGDMLAGNGMAGRVVVSVGKPSGNSVEVRTQGADSAVATTFIGTASQVLVATLDLTPAQQHADEMFAILDAMPTTPAIAAVLDKIRPPVAPTAAEYLAAIAAAHEGKDPDIKQRLAALIDRATRANALKGK